MKNEIYSKCLHTLDEKIQTMQDMLAELKTSIMSDTKSSAGDKHETGRAMAQIEIENNQGQLNEVLKMKETLLRIIPDQAHKKIQLGSVVHTNRGNFYIAVPIGKIKLNSGEEYYVTSASSPLAQILIGHKRSDEVLFDAQMLTILNVE